MTLEDEVGYANSYASQKFTWQRALLLLAMFLLVVSDYFVANIISLVPEGTYGRKITNRGIVAQGICLVILYAVATSLSDAHIL